jgi:dTMP kinase
MRNGPPRPPPPPGWLIAFEGVEGAGKTTQLEFLRRELEARGYKVVVTREPGGTRVGERIRALLLDPEAGDGELGARTEALLFAAARAELVQRVIQPALERGQVVLCDRFIDSSLVYQGVARGLGHRAVAAVNDFATGGLQPDLVVLLRLDPAEGLARARDRRQERAADRIEAEDLRFHRLVEQGFLLLAAEQPERFAVIDAAPPVEQVAAEVRRAVLRRLSRARPRHPPTPTDAQPEQPEAWGAAPQPPTRERR